MHPANSLAVAMDSVPEPPCAHCFNYARCRQSEIACVLFVSYVHFEYQRKPIYKLLKYLGLLRAPTKSGYDLAFER